MPTVGVNSEEYRVWMAQTLAKQTSHKEENVLSAEGVNSEEYRVWKAQTLAKQTRTHEKTLLTFNTRRVWAKIIHP